MDIGALLLILALLILVALFVSRPLLERQPAATMQEEQAVSSLLAERDRILTALQELDFDRALGKIPAEDYPLQRSSLLQRGAGILRQLDALTTSNALPSLDATVRAALAWTPGQASNGGIPAVSPRRDGSRGPNGVRDGRAGSADSSSSAKRPSGVSTRGVSASAEERLEAAIASRRADAAEKAASAKETTDEDLEALIAKRRAVLKDKAAGFCPNCGRPILSSDSFCPKCGYALK